MIGKYKSRKSRKRALRLNQRGHHEGTYRPEKQDQPTKTVADIFPKVLAALARRAGRGN